MRTLKELLLVVLDAIDMPHTEDRPGICMLVSELQFYNKLTWYEEQLILKYLEIAILLPFSEKYPITYYKYKSSIRKSDSIYFFPPHDWDVRRKWLKEVISNLG